MEWPIIDHHLIPSQGWAILCFLWDGPCLLKVSGVFDFFVSISAGYRRDLLQILISVLSECLNLLQVLGYMDLCIVLPMTL